MLFRSAEYIETRATVQLLVTVMMSQNSPENETGNFDSQTLLQDQETGACDSHITYLDAVI